MSDYHAEVTAIAHRIWEEEGRPENRAEDHWRRAEAELASDTPAEDAGKEIALAD